MALSMSASVPSLPLDHRLSIPLLALLLYLVYRVLLHPRFLSSVRNIPGPPRDSLFSGNLQTIFKADAGVPHKQWSDKYGSTFVYGGFLGQDRLYTTDPKALSHILVNKAYDYPKPMQLRVALARILGEGVLFVEGDQHKRQRRVLNAPFTQASVNSYLPIFQEQAEKLISKLDDAIANDETLEKKKDYTVVNVYTWLSRATLDVIGRAGFDYDFGALDDEENELANVFQNMLHPRKISLGMISSQWLMHHLPFLTKIPTKATTRINKTTEVMQREGKKMLEQRRQQAKDGELEGKRDLLSLLVKANMEATNPKDQLRDDEIMGQLSTFSLAGHETSSVALSWILYYLCVHPEVQVKLRNEIQAMHNEMTANGQSELTADDIAKMPYMDAVVRETLRYAPPVYLTNREPTHEDAIPLSEPITGKDGKPINSIHVKKGQQIVVGIYTMNRNKEIFGEDADDFRPERWLEKEQDASSKAEKGSSLSLSEKQKQFGFTAWSPLMTFLAGPRGCIGYRFAIYEVKIILFFLVLNFEFLERDEGGTPICKRSNVVTRPVVVGEEEKGGQLPLRMRRVKRGVPNKQ